jgi:hypothetical protein
MWIGAVGHRALWPEHEAPLRRAVGEVLDDVKRRWGAMLEPRLLTSLAEGSDQLIASEAHARGWKLGVPLPLPDALYERDFGSPALLENYRKLRGQAELVFDVGLAPGASLEQVAEPGNAREAQYARAGRVVAETCPILIALWDGEARNRVGGTSEMIARALSGWREDDEPIQVLNPRQPKLVYHVWTPSRERPDVTGIPFTWRLLSSKPVDGDEDDGELFGEMLARLGELDADVCSRLGGRREEHELSAANAIAPDQAAAMPQGIRGLLRWYGIADALALQFQRKTKSVLPLLLTIAVLALGAYEVNSYWPSHPLWGLEAFVIAFLSMIFAVNRIKKHQHERKFLDYRALAEGLRVQLFWRLCGLPDSVSEHYLRKHRGELSWIPLAVASLSLGAVFPPSDDAAGAWPLGRRRRLARENWVERQRSFYVSKARADTGRERSFGRAAYALLWLAMVCVGWLWLDGRFLHFMREREELHAALHIGIGAMLAGSAAWRHLVERRSYATHARRYELMHLLASRAGEAVGEDRESLESASATAIFREFGRESLAENGDWLLLHRERPLEVPPPA